MNYKRFEGAEKGGITYNYYIDDEQKLRDLIKKDIVAENYPDPAILDMFKVNFSDFKIWFQKNKVIGTGFFHTKKIRSYFIFTKPELIKTYKMHLKSQEKIINYKLHVLVKAIANNKGSIFIDIQSFLKKENIPNDLQFITRENNFIEIIIISNETTNEKSFIANSLDRIERIINCYSYIKKVGFQIISSNIEEYLEKVYQFHLVKLLKCITQLIIMKLINFLKNMSISILFLIDIIVHYVR